MTQPKETPTEREARIQRILRQMEEKLRQQLPDPDQPLEQIEQEGVDLGRDLRAIIEQETVDAAGLRPGGRGSCTRRWTGCMCTSAGSGKRRRWVRCTNAAPRAGWHGSPIALPWPTRRRLGGGCGRWRTPKGLTTAGSGRYWETGRNG